MAYVINLLKPNVYITFTDLKDTLFQVPVHPIFQIYLKFYLYSNLDVCLTRQYWIWELRFFL